MILTVTLNPAMDKTVFLPRLTINGTNRVSSTRLDAGGKGINVSKTVHALGGDTLAMGILGGESGLYIQHCLAEMGINSVFSMSETPTRTNIKLMDESMHSSTEINERGGAVEKQTFEDVFSNLSRRVHPGDYVVFAGTVPPETPDDLIAGWVREMKSAGAKVCMDMVGTPMLMAIEEKPFLIKPNKSELEDICGRHLYYDIDVIAAAKELVERGIERVVVSLGAEGALFVTENQVLRGFTVKVPVKGQTGAGDSMMAALAYYSEQGCSWSEICQRSMAISSAHVMHPGSETATAEEMEALLPQIRIEELM